MTDFTVFDEPQESAWQLLRVQTANSVYTVAMYRDGARQLTVLRGATGESSRDLEVHDSNARLDDGRSLFETSPWADWRGHGLHVGSMRTSPVEHVSTEANAALCETLSSTYLELVGPPADPLQRGPLDRTSLGRPAGARPLPPSFMPIRGSAPAIPPASAPASAPAKPAPPKKSRGKKRKSSKGRRISPRQLVDLAERAKIELRRLEEDPKMFDKLMKNDELRPRYIRALTGFVPVIERLLEAYHQAEAGEGAEDE